MLKKTIIYSDYNGSERTEDFYFNLSRAEVMEMEMGTTGGLSEMIQKIVAAQDTPAVELWDEKKQEFIRTKEQALQLEHSLVSVSKWEAKYHKAFLSKQEKSFEETIDYVKCMTLTQNVDSKVYQYLTNDNINQINKYIEAPMTATYFTDDKIAKNSREQITAELVYYWMIALNIPFECQKWHLNRLLILIKVCNVKNQKPKAIGRKEMARRNAALNSARRKQLNTRG